MAHDARQQLLDRSRNGDGDALGELLDQLRPYVRFLVRAAGQRSVQARQDDSDLIQDTMLVAHQAFPRFRGDTVAQFAGWLRTVALRTLGHAVRAQVATGKRSISREQVVGDLDQIGKIVADGDQHEQSARVAAALERLPQEMRDLLVGRFFDDLSYAELATRMNRSEGALRVLHTRALRRLRDELGH